MCVCVCVCVLSHTVDCNSSLKEDCLSDFQILTDQTVLATEIHHTVSSKWYSVQCKLVFIDSIGYMADWFAGLVGLDHLLAMEQDFESK